MKFFVTRHAHLAGVRLSRAGSHGNLPFPDYQAAIDAAEVEANGQPFTIERENCPALPKYTGCNHEHL